MKVSKRTAGAVAVAAAAATAVALAPGLAPSSLPGEAPRASISAASSSAPATGRSSTPASERAGGERPSFAVAAGQQFAPQQVIVVPESDAGTPAVRSAAQRLGGTVDRVLPNGRVHTLRLPPSLSVPEAVSRLERLPGVRFAEPDYLVRPTDLAAQPLAAATEPNDPDYRRLWGLDNTGQTGGTPDADIDAPTAWSATVGTAGAPIAVIDTGVDVGHPDLAANIWTNPGEKAGNKIDDDGNGYVDDVRGWDFRNEDNSVYDGPDDAHGTHVAGTIAAVGGNGRGVTGVNWRARIMPLKFLGPDGGYTSDAIEALDYAVANGARISNHSWGGGGASKALSDAITRAGQAGHLLVAAAGNGGADGIGDDIDVLPTYPAAYPQQNLVSVAASDDDDRLATFSNFGRTHVDLAAPGVGILSTLPGSAYGVYSGTSMATPHVAGAAALLLSAEPGQTALGLREQLLSTVDQPAALRLFTATGGRLDLGSAVGAAGASGTELTISARPTTTRYRAATALSGTLSVDGEPASGRSVTLQARPIGASSWSAVSKTSTGSTGEYAFTGLRPARHTDYRATHAPPDGSTPVTSTARRVNVAVAVSLATRTTKLRRGRSRALTGVVQPAHGGKVVLVARRNGSVVLRRGLTLDDSRFRYVFRTSRTGRYSFVVSRASDVDHLGGTSPSRSFRVVR